MTNVMVQSDTLKIESNFINHKSHINQEKVKVADYEGKTALLFIDIQEEFLNEFTKPCLKRIIDFNKNKKNLYDFRIATIFENDDNSPFRSHKVIKDKKIVPLYDKNTNSDQEFEDFVYESDLIVKKNTYSVPDSLISYLHDHDIKNVHIVGFDSDACVLSTMFKLFDAGISVSVISDLCASSGGHDIHLSAVTIMRRSIEESSVIFGKNVE